ncbi:MAG: hypothetical protein IT385_04525 [Deltaproteobacteria bacterium]|nr:hypothetical protein [Deltaproteobacteria bacterium]
MAEGRWFARDVKAQDRAKLTALIEGAHRAESIYIRGALERFLANPDAGARDPNALWWWGVFRNGTELEAVMAVENHVALVYAANEEAMKTFANELYAMQKRVGQGGGGTHRHQILGESKNIAILWNVMKDLPGRKLVTDRECDLMSGSERAAASPSSRITFDRATRADERTVVDYLAEIRLEQLQIDPRKVNKDAHTQRCMNAIADGRVWLGREKDTGRPFFAAELTPLTSDALLLDQVYVPPHYRSRGKLMGGAFWAAAGIAEDKELYYLAQDKTLGEAAKSAGWKRRSGYRWVVSLG